ncbi:MAG: asparagine synthase C-terminal domain-containing protein [Candidatus Nanoarchaeia archaeon]
MTHSENKELEEHSKEVLRLFSEAVERALNEFYKTNRKKIGVLFSGGVDSTFIAYTLQNKSKSFSCYTAALKGDGLSPARDLVSSRSVSKKYGFILQENILEINEMEECLKKVIKIIDSTNIVKVGVALPVFLAMKKAAEDNVEGVFSGLGSEEIFAGYQRHAQAEDINEECRRGMEGIQERDLDRDNKIAEYFGIKILLPFLDKKIVDYALNIPGHLKINKEHKKLVLREAAVHAGIDMNTAYRKKLGAQYGSKFDRGIQKLAKKKGFKYKSEYLESLY